MNKLSKTQLYVFICLVEEANEVAQAACKVLRDQYDNYIETTGDTSALTHLKDEINDLFACVEMLGLETDPMRVAKKKEKIRNYLRTGVRNV